MTTAPAAAARRHEGSTIHPEGRMPLAVAATLLLIWVLQASKQTRVPRLRLGLSLGSLAFLAQFFRHPSCTTPMDPDLVVAPAYGRIVHIGIEDEPEILGDRRLRVSTFLSLFDPHLTRSPVSGRVVYQKYHPGRFLVALHPKSSTLNERNSVLIEDEGGTAVLVRQIAGLLARRICSYTCPGAAVSAGEEVGFIKLGSRVDVFLPESSEVLVRLGQRVSAGQTAVAHLTSGAG